MVMEDKDVQAVAALTAPATIRLVTARTIKAGLALLGLVWVPVAYEDLPDGTRTGLYTWGYGGPTPAADHDRPVVYVGVGDGRGGLSNRLGREHGWISDEASHVHGHAMHRWKAAVVAGQVEQVKVDLDWLPATIGEDGAATLSSWLRDSGASPAAMAEGVAIRAAGFLGDCCPPINASYATAWDTDSAQDWGGLAVARRLLGTQL